MWLSSVDPGFTHLKGALKTFIIALAWIYIASSLSFEQSAIDYVLKALIFCCAICSRVAKDEYRGISIIFFVLCAMSLPSLLYVFSLHGYEAFASAFLVFCLFYLKKTNSNFSALSTFLSLHILNMSLQRQTSQYFLVYISTAIVGSLFYLLIFSYFKENTSSLYSVLYFNNERVLHNIDRILLNRSSLSAEEIYTQMYQDCTKYEYIGHQSWISSWEWNEWQNTCYRTKQLWKTIYTLIISYTRMRDSSTLEDFYQEITRSNLMPKLCFFLMSYSLSADAYTKVSKDYQEAIDGLCGYADYSYELEDKNTVCEFIMLHYFVLDQASSLKDLL